MQNRYNVADRQSEDVLDAAASEPGSAFLPWARSRPATSPDPAAARRVADATARRPAQVALAWLLPVAGHAAHPRHRSVAHLEENIAAAALQLGDDELRAFDSLAA